MRTSRCRLMVPGAITVLVLSCGEDIVEPPPDPPAVSVSFAEDSLPSWSATRTSLFVALSVSNPC